jgi:hypothetical protein
MSFYDEFFEALAEREIRYLVVGGVAVVLHGFLRATADLDLMVALDSANMNTLVELLKSRGYRPKAPVQLEDLADPLKRKEWAAEKGMLVFSLFHPKRTRELIDIFITEPIDFNDAYARRKTVQLGERQVQVVSASDLIKMKELASRPQDLVDIKALKAREDQP